MSVHQQQTRRRNKQNIDELYQRDEQIARALDGDDCPTKKNRKAVVTVVAARNNAYGFKLILFITAQFWIYYHCRQLHYTDINKNGLHLHHHEENKHNYSLTEFLLPLNESPESPENVGPCRSLKYYQGSKYHKPIWVASFPASGDFLLQKLVVALTGRIHDNGSNYVKQDWPHIGCLDIKAATCKTHWPILEQHGPLDYDGNGYDSRAIMMLRNPMQAFLHRMVHKWKQTKARKEQQHKMPPEEAWKSWIQLNWKQQIRQYQNLITSWMQIKRNSNQSTNPAIFNTPKVVLILAYEELINQNENIGNHWAQRFADVLRMAHNRVALPEHVACLWEHTVLSINDASPWTANVTYSYTREQHNDIINMVIELVALSEKYGKKELNRILQVYLDEITRYKQVAL
jgi:hypothetical protein